MAFTIKPNKQKIKKIKENSEKQTLKDKTAALDSWSTEGGLVADETTAMLPKRVAVYNKQKPLQRRHNQRSW